MNSLQPQKHVTDDCLFLISSLQSWRCLGPPVLSPWTESFLSTQPFKLQNIQLWAFDASVPDKQRCVCVCVAVGEVQALPIPLRLHVCVCVLQPRDGGAVRLIWKWRERVVSSTLPLGEPSGNQKSPGLPLSRGCLWSDASTVVHWLHIVPSNTHSQTCCWSCSTDPHIKLPRLVLPLLPDSQCGQWAHSLCCSLRS